MFMNTPPTARLTTRTTAKDREPASPVHHPIAATAPRPKQWASRADGNERGGRPKQPGRLVKHIEPSGPLHIVRTTQKV